jgi:hypothetical protein
MSADDDTQPYETLASLIEHELELVSQRSFDDLQVLARTRAQLQDSLPPTPAPAARPALERCALLHKRVEIELLRVRESLLLELGHVHHAQRTADGYAPKPVRSSLVSTSA